MGLGCWVEVGLNGYGNGSGLRSGDRQFMVRGRWNQERPRHFTVQQPNYANKENPNQPLSGMGDPETPINKNSTIFIVKTCILYDLPPHPPTLSHSPVKIGHQQYSPLSTPPLSSRIHEPQKYITQQELHTSPLR